MQTMKQKKLINFLKKLTFKVNSLTIAIQNWTVMKQMQMAGMKIDREKEPRWKTITRFAFGIIPLGLCILFIVKGRWFLGLVIFFIGGMLIDYLLKFLFRIRFKII